MRRALIPLLLAAAACADGSGAGSRTEPAPGGEIDVTAEVDNLTVTPREGDLVTVLFRVTNRTRRPVILRDLTLPVDLMFGGSSGVATWQYAQSGLLTYLADRDEWVYDKSRRATTSRPVFNSGLLVPTESLVLRARVRLLTMPMNFQFSYFELTPEELHRKVYFEKRDPREKVVRYRLLVGSELDDALTPSLRTEAGGHRFVVFPHAEPVASTTLLKTFQFQTPLKPRLFSLEQAARVAGVEKPRPGDYTFSNVFDAWVIKKGDGHVLVAPTGVTELPELKQVERTFHLLDNTGAGKIEIELRSHSAATALAELRYPLVKQEKEVPVTKEVKEKKVFYYLFPTIDQMGKLFQDLKTLHLVVDVEYGEGGGRLQVLNR